MPSPTLLVPGTLRLDSGVAPSDVTPVDFIAGWIRRRMPEFSSEPATPENRILVVKAKTGSGKSTVLPVGVFRILRDKSTPPRQRFRGGGVLCTQPRVLTAIELAKDVTAERYIDGARVRFNPDLALGARGTVGYQTGGPSDHPPRGLTYATAGVLATQLQHRTDDEMMNAYRFILVDEAHERSLDSDLLLLLLKNFFKRNEGNPRLFFVLLLSATFDPRRYADYFGVGAENVMRVKGRTHPIATHWPPRGTNNVPVEAAAVAARIHEESPNDPPEKADIMVFVPGGREAGAVAEALRERAEAYGSQGPPPFLVLLLNREVVQSQAGDYLRLKEAPALLPKVGGRRPSRRIIVATTVAETGLTIDTLRCVVDCGWSRTKEAYPPWGVVGLLTRPAPQSRIKQRMGRVGRLFPGDFYPLYTENVHEALDPQQAPDIITAGPAEIFLFLVWEQQRQKLRRRLEPEFRLEDLGLLDPPPPFAYLEAQAVAVACGFFAAAAPLPREWPPADPADQPAFSAQEAPPRGCGLTPLGQLAVKLGRVSMEGARVLLAGYVYDAAAADLATLVALFDSKPTSLLSVTELLKPPEGGLPPGARALRACLPPPLVSRHGGGEKAAPPTEEEAQYLRARLVLADDFLEGLLVFDAFAARLEGAEENLKGVADWAEGLGLNFTALVELARRREEVLTALVAAGLDPFRQDARRLAAAPLEEFTERAARLKRCLYEGLRGRLLRWEPEGSAGPGYYTKQGVRVRAPPLLSEVTLDRVRALEGESSVPAGWRPRWVVTDRVQFAPARPRPGEKEPPLLYEVRAGRVSVLDGAVDPDPDFDEPRAFSEGISGPA